MHILYMMCRRMTIILLYPVSIINYYIFSVSYVCGLQPAVSRIDRWSVTADAYIGESEKAATGCLMILIVNTHFGFCDCNIP